MITSRHRLALLLALSAPLTSTTPAHAGPTASADLALGTSTQGNPSSAADYQGPPEPTPSPLYTVGFTLRAGWRFDIAQAPVWLLPEIGAGYSVERLVPAIDGTSAPSPHLTRFFGGGRVGWTYALRPELRFEPAIFGHAGAGWYGSGPAPVGSAFDAGLSLDLRIRSHFTVGAQVGYDVVTRYPQPTTTPPMTVVTVTGPVIVPGSTTLPLPPIADPWVSHGVHAGWLFW